MKKLIIVISLIFWGIIGAGEISAHHGVSGYFYNGLSPYGSWIEIDYGVVVWRPTVMNVEWSPYMEGRWIWTTDGWYWYSYEPFGDITYHYGRWYFDDYYGWLWYPDYDWAPAWVEWRYDNDYIGWAPLHPYAIFTIGVGIHFSTSYYTPYYHWHFVNYNYFYDPYVYKHCVGPKYKYRIYSNTRYRTNYGYRAGRIRNNGVDIDVIRKRGGSNIRVRDLERDANFTKLDDNPIRDEGKIKTYYRTRDELVKNEVRDIKFERSNRKSTLDVTRLDRRDLKERNTSLNNGVDKNSGREIRNETITRDNKTLTDKKNDVNTFETRKNTNTEIKRNNGNTDRKIEKKDVRKNTTLDNNRVNRNNNNQKKEVKTNRNNTQKQEVKTFRKDDQKKEIKVNTNTQNKNTVKTNRNTTRKNQTNVNRNTDRNNTKRKR